MWGLDQEFPELTSPCPGFLLSRRDPACRKVKLLELEVLESIYVVEVVKDPGTGEVSF